MTTDPFGTLETRLQLVIRLESDTRQGLLKWQESPRPGSFYVYTDRFNLTLYDRDNDGQPPYILEVRRKSNRYATDTLESMLPNPANNITIPVATNFNMHLQSLYNAAVQSARGATTLLTEILSDLTSLEEKGAQQEEEPPPF